MGGGGGDMESTIVCNHKLRLVPWLSYLSW